MLIEAMNNPEMKVIFDMQGYLSGQSASDFIIENLLKDTVAPENIFTPKIYGPEDVDWIGGPNVYAPGPNRNREKAKFFFLADVSAMSASEPCWVSSKPLSSERSSASQWQVGTRASTRCTYREECR